MHKDFDENHSRSARLSNPQFFLALTLVMRQQGTKKVMWNIRLFKGMQLLPRQVSEGDRRMDVYIKMVLVDNGQPRSYAIKVRPSHIRVESSYEVI